MMSKFQIRTGQNHNPTKYYSFKMSEKLSFVVEKYLINAISNIKKGTVEKM